MLEENEVVDNEEDSFNLLNHLEKHLASTSERLWEDRADAMTKQLKKWGIDKSHITSEPPYVYVDGYRFQYFEDRDGLPCYEIKKGNHNPRVAMSFQGVLGVIRQFERKGGRPEK